MMLKNYIIDSIEIIAGNIKLFKLNSKESKEPEQFKAGQFVFIHILDENQKSVDKRPYSIASAPNEKYLEFCIDMINGRFTSKLDKLKVGEIVGLEGPLGHLTYENQPKIGLICGGTGIAPMMSIVRDIVKKKSAQSAAIFYSSKTEERVIFKKELEEINKHDKVKTIITLTKDEENKNWKGERGRISKEMIEKYVKDAPERFWFICGPLEMIKVMKEALLELGADPKKLKMEGWG